MMRIHTKCLAVVIMLFGYMPFFIWILLYKSDTPDETQVEIYHETTSQRHNLKINKVQNMNRENVYNELPDMEYPSFTCSTNRLSGKANTEIEDILCMKRPRFLKNYKNPCWMDDGVTLTCLPYFHIFGVCRSGTTDLFRRIRMHPQIMGNKETLKKETWFWSWRRYGEYTKGEPLKLKNFTDMFNVLPNRLKYDRKTDRFYSDYITGHGDPMDIWYPYDWKKIMQNNPNLLEPKYTTPHLIYHINPNIKFILLMRDPVDRIHSHYLHIKLGQDRQPSMEDFDFDVTQSIKLFYKCVSEKELRPCLYDYNLYRQMRVPVTSGFYDVFLKDWLKVFDKNQFLVIHTEDYAKNIPATLVKVFKFLELDAVDTKILHKMSCEDRTHKTVGKEQMSQETRESLTGFYAGSQDNLRKLIKEYQLDLTINSIPNNIFYKNCPTLPRRMMSNRLQNQNPEVKHYRIHKQNKQQFIGLKPP